MLPDSDQPQARPPRQCGECGETFAASVSRKHNLELCKACSDQQDAFNNLCPPIYRASDPARLPCGTEKLGRVLAWQPNERGLLLHGPTGRGKTRAAWLLLRKLHFAGVRFIAFDAVSFSHEVARQFGSAEGPDRWLKRLYTAPVVFLDDVGKCRLTERGEAEVFGLVETRTANGKPIVATTNFVGDALATTLRGGTGEPLVRRLREFCECIPF